MQLMADRILKAVDVCDPKNWERMKFTIITVCYNAEAHIEECLRDVAAQTHSNIEHIVVDGASKDRTVEIVRRFPHVAQLVCEPDRGIYDAMNKGIARASGDYILFLNADDGLPLPTSLADAAREIEQNPGGDVYYGSLDVRPLGREPVIYRPPPPEEAPMLMVCGCLPHQATFARPSVFEKTGPFDRQYAYHADYDWFLKILAEPEIDIRAIPTIVAVFREGGASSDLAKGQPEVYSIQNASPLYASEDWDKRRISEFQKKYLKERIKNERLRGAIRTLWQTSERHDPARPPERAPKKRRSRRLRKLKRALRTLAEGNWR